MLRYLYDEGTFTREELKEQVEREAAALDPEQWMFGKFEFDEWLSDSIATGSVVKDGGDL